MSLMERATEEIHLTCFMSSDESKKFNAMRTIQVANSKHLYQMMMMMILFTSLNIED